MIELNKNILANANGEKFITAFIGKYNLKTRNLQFINAGHNPPLLMLGHKFKSLVDGCTILGIFENLPSLTEKNISIPKGSILACYTDGVVEQINSNNEEFGMDKLEKIILQNKEKTTNGIIDAIVNELDDYKEKASYNDDIALMCLRIK